MKSKLKKSSLLLVTLSLWASTGCEKRSASAGANSVDAATESSESIDMLKELAVILNYVEVSASDMMASQSSPSTLPFNKDSKASDAAAEPLTKKSVSVVNGLLESVQHLNSILAEQSNDEVRSILQELLTKLAGIQTAGKAVFLEASQESESGMGLYGRQSARYTYAPPPSVYRTPTYVQPVIIYRTPTYVPVYPVYVTPTYVPPAPNYYRTYRQPVPDAQMQDALRRLQYLNSTLNSPRY